VSPIDEQGRPALARGVRLQTDPKNQEPVLLFPEGAIYLNETAYDIVTRCAGQLTAEGIVASLAAEYETNPESLRKDVLDCLRDLVERKLLVFSK
jgi:coenzyme PQQ biosynthesis protein PqqD